MNTTKEVAPARSRQALKSPTKSAEDRCQERLRKKLVDLFEKEVLHNSLQPGVRTSNFSVFHWGLKMDYLCTECAVNLLSS